KTALRGLSKSPIPRSRPSSGLRARETGRPRHDGDEREHSERAQDAAGKPFVEESRAGDDRKRVCEERRHTGRRERRSALEAVLAGERGAEQGEPDHGGRDSRELPLRESDPGRLPREQREDPDAPGGGGLDERQGRERERGDVQHPATDPDEEADQPATISEEDDERVDRVTERESREPARGLVLGEVAPVERARGGERKPETAEERRAHPSLRSREANGRYASAASAAMPTRGRSRRRS